MNESTKCFITLCSQFSAAKHVSEFKNILCKYHEDEERAQLQFKFIKMGWVRKVMTNMFQINYCRYQCKDKCYCIRRYIFSKIHIQRYLSDNQANDKFSDKIK
jgi:hypothetical protein